MKEDLSDRHKLAAAAKRPTKKKPKDKVRFYKIIYIIPTTAYIVVFPCRVAN